MGRGEREETREKREGEEKKQKKQKKKKKKKNPRVSVATMELGGAGPGASIVPEVQNPAICHRFL